MIVWGQKLGNPECPYNERWILDFGLFSLRLHHWMGSDDPRHLHDHGWWYISLVLIGAYFDVSPNGSKLRKSGSLEFFPATHRHTVQLATKSCWTIILTGPERREWGFWVNGKFKKRNRYFFDYKRHPCDNGQVR